MPKKLSNGHIDMRGQMPASRLVSIPVVGGNECVTEFVAQYYKDSP